MLCVGSQMDVFGQSNLKEGNNQYALYSNSGDVKQLDAARKHADDAYKTKRDSVSFRNNLLRALVYGTLSVVDSNRTRKYTEDPLITAELALARLTDRQLRFENEPEIKHAIRNLANGQLIVANRALQKGDNEEAYKRFLKVHEIAAGTYDVRHNLAILNHRLGKDEEAVTHYQELLRDPKTAKPSYFHALANIFESQSKDMQLLNILVDGHEMYPNNKNILFRLINTYNQKQAFEAIVPLAEYALKLDPTNTRLLYIIAYAYDVTGNQDEALENYQNLVELDRNNYEGNLGLGLIYLEEYVKNANSRNAERRAQDHLLRANQIKPSGINTLKSLAVLYKTKGDIVQLERVNNILNQLTLH